MPSAARLRPPPALHAPRCATLSQILRCAQDDNKSGNKGNNKSNSKGNCKGNNKSNSKSNSKGNSKGNNKSQKQKLVTLSAAKGLASRRVGRREGSGVAKGRAQCRVGRRETPSVSKGEGALARPRTPRQGWRGRAATQGGLVPMACSSCACRPPDPSGFALRMTSREGCGFAAQGVTGAATTRRLPSPGAESVDDDTCHGNLFRDAGSMLRTPADLKPARPLRGRGGECTSGITAPGLRVRQRRGRNESAVSSTRPREVP